MGAKPAALPVQLAQLPERVLFCKVLCSKWVSSSLKPPLWCWLVGWWVGGWVGWLAGWLVGWLVGWSGLVWFGLGWVGLGWVGLGWFVGWLGLAGPGWAFGGLTWVGLGCVGAPVGPGWARGFGMGRARIGGLGLTSAERVLCYHNMSLVVKGGMPI